MNRYITNYLQIIILISLRISYTNCLTVDIKQPNIVIIMGDDMGWNDVGFHGNNVLKTPNIDALAYNGIILNNHYSLPMCTPSRAALLTGQYPIRTGFQGWPIIAGEDRSLPLNVPLMPELLRELNYATHLVGKWHLGHAYRNVTPNDRGFDTFFGYWNGFIGYENYVASNNIFQGIDLHDGYEPINTTIGKYATDVFTEKAEYVINNRDEKRPLFLILSHLATHTGWDGVELGVRNETENDIEFKHINDKRRRKYAGVMKSFDDSVGRIVKCLNKNKILDDTIVLVFSDNGGPTVDLYSNTASNWPLRGIKGSVMQGGTRTFAIVWSSRFKYNRNVNNELFHITDWLPTLYGAAGGDVKSLGKIDGVNQWDTLVNNKKSKRDELLLNIDEKRNEAGLIGYGGAFKLVEVDRNDTDIFYGYYGDVEENELKRRYNYKSILRSTVNRELSSLTKFKRINVYNIIKSRREASLRNCRKNINNNAINELKLALFDLENDPCETTNVANKYSEVLEQLRIRLDEFKNELIPQKNKNPDVCSNPAFFNGYWSNWLSNPNPNCTRIQLIN